MKLLYTFKILMGKKGIKNPGSILPGVLLSLILELSLHLFTCYY